LQQVDRFAPRALLVTPRITFGVAPSELHKLIWVIEDEAQQALADGLDDYADFLLRRVAELHKAAR
jgi:hypothetical protein